MKNNEPMFPESWQSRIAADCFLQISTTLKKIKTKDCNEIGLYPVIDQGQASVAGYIDDPSKVIEVDSPLCIFGDHTRVVKWVDRNFVPGADGTKVLLPLTFLSPRFAYYQLCNMDIPDKGYSRHFKYFKELWFGIPPLAEQKAIAEKLDTLLTQVETIKARLARTLETLKQFRQSVLAAAVSGKLTEDWRGLHEKYVEFCGYTVPASWLNSSIGKESEYVTSGSRGWAKYYSDSGSLFIRSQDINSDELNIQNAAYVQLPEKIEGQRTKVQINDLLVTITGANITKCARLKTNLDDAYISQHVALIRLKSPENSAFFELVLKALNAGRKQLNAMAYGGGKPGLNLQNIKDVEFAKPSSSIEADEIVSRVNKLFAGADATEQQVNQALERVNNLTQSILAKAFRGELTEQWRKDNPDLISGDNSAEALLKKIKAERAAAKPKRKTKK